MFRLRFSLFLLLPCFLTCFSGPLHAQKSTYVVRLAGKIIGEVTASRIESPHSQTYEILSDVNFKVLWKQYNRKTTSLVVFENDAIKSSVSGVYMNNDLEDSASMDLHQNNYRCYRYPDENFVLSDTKVSFTTSKLYFQEPVGIKEVYSERFLTYCPLESRGDNKYKLLLPNGKANYYTYANNTLVEVFVDRTWFNLKFQQE